MYFRELKNKEDQLTVVHSECDYGSGTTMTRWYREDTRIETNDPSRKPVYAVKVTESLGSKLYRLSIEIHRRIII